jgi:sulfane dehydrogenase subunit SoxC
MTSCSEWTGVLLSTLLKECGLKGSAKWFVAEGAEEVKGASSIPIAKGMDDCIVAYGQNGEPLRPQQGFPVRLMVPDSRASTTPSFCGASRSSTGFT